MVGTAASIGWAVLTAAIGIWLGAVGPRLLPTEGARGDEERGDHPGHQDQQVARDRVGKKPLLYAQLNGGLVFGSEFSALLLHPEISRDVDSEALHHYLSFMCVPAPLTAYRAIRKLEPGHSLRWRKGEINGGFCERQFAFRGA